MAVNHLFFCERIFKASGERVERVTSPSESSSVRSHPRRSSNPARFVIGLFIPITSCRRRRRRRGNFLRFSTALKQTRPSDSKTKKFYLSPSILLRHLLPLFSASPLFHRQQRRRLRWSKEVIFPSLDSVSFRKSQLVVFSVLHLLFHLQSCYYSFG